MVNLLGNCAETCSPQWVLLEWKKQNNSGTDGPCPIHSRYRTYIARLSYPFSPPSSLSGNSADTYSYPKSDDDARHRLLPRNQFFQPIVSTHAFYQFYAPTFLLRWQERADRSEWIEKWANCRGRSNCQKRNNYVVPDGDNKVDSHFQEPCYELVAIYCC